MNQTFPNHHIHDKDNQLRTFFNHLLDEGFCQQFGYCMSIQGIFYNMIISMIRLSTTYHSPDKQPDILSGSIGYFNQAIHFINQNISNNIKVSDIASQIGISEIYLYKIFMKHAKKTPQQLLLAYRVQLAKNYLRNPSLSIKTISSELGFSNPNHFSMLFKKSTGLSPREYRNSFSENNMIVQEDFESKCSCKG